MGRIGNGGEIQELRKSLDLTQQVVANRMGIPRAQLSLYENARVLPSLWNFILLRKALRLKKPDALFAAFEAVWKRRRTRTNGGPR